jgi:methionine-rich copper-binding protein CopC
MLRTRCALVLVAAATLLLWAPGIAAAHAELEATVPADGATVVGTPDELSATFSEALGAESTLSIRNAAGERLAVGGLDPADAARLLIAPVPELAPGAYEMRWTAFSADGDLVKGTWTFEVEAPPATPTPAPTPVTTDSGSEPPTAAPTPSTTPAATPSPSATPDDGAPTSGSGDVILPIIAALAIVTIGGVLLLGRRGRPGATG